jgi:NAD+ kinase
LSLKLNKVLVIYKKSTFQIQAVEHRESHFIKLLEEHSDTVTRVKVAHDEHYSALEAIQTELSARKVNFEAVARVDINGPITGVDLVISVGGDGTFLDASHFLEDVPLLGVNSSRSSSFGHFCLANQGNLAEVLDDIEGGREPCDLLRLELELNGSVLPELVLNEVLVCHSNPAGTSRYFIDINGQREEQRSSGIWVGPPSGSTGSIRAAGGVILPIIDQQYQYIVREPGPRPKERYQLLKDLLPATTELHVTSQMRTGALYIDGQHIDYGFPLGDELVIRASKNSLRAFVNPTVNDIFRQAHA